MACAAFTSGRGAGQSLGIRSYAIQCAPDWRNRIHGDSKHVKNKARTELATTLADFLCYAVYSTHLAFGRAYQPLLDSLGLTYLQYAALIALAEEDGQTVGGLGEKLFLDSSTLTPLLKRLEAAGFVTRKRDPRDERQVRIGLTKAGRDVRQKAFTGRAALIDACGLSPGDFTRLQKDLVKLRSNLLASTET
jgi:MarR family transcriptional regulator, organic hydroperoxide resistance regulator